MGPIRTRDVQATLDMLYVQYGAVYQVMSIREIDGWFEIWVDLPVVEHQ